MAGAGAGHHAEVPTRRGLSLAYRPQAGRVGLEREPRSRRWRARVIAGLVAVRHAEGSHAPWFVAAYPSHRLVVFGLERGPRSCRLDSVVMLGLVPAAIPRLPVHRGLSVAYRPQVGRVGLERDLETRRSAAARGVVMLGLVPAIMPRPQSRVPTLPVVHRLPVLA